MLGYAFASSLWYSNEKERFSLELFTYCMFYAYISILYAYAIKRIALHINRPRSSDSLQIQLTGQERQFSSPIFAVQFAIQLLLDVLGGKKKQPRNKQVLNACILGLRCTSGTSALHAATARCTLSLLQLSWLCPSPWSFPPSLRLCSALGTLFAWRVRNICRFAV